MKESGSKALSARYTTTASRIGRYNTRTTIGRNCRDKRCTGWPGARHDDTQGHTSQPLHVGNVHGLLIFPYSKHPSCVRGRLPVRPTECASVRCHSSAHYTMEPPKSYNLDCRCLSQVGSYRPGIRPSKLLTVRLGRQFPVGVLGRLLDCKAQRNLR